MGESNIMENYCIHMFDSPNKKPYHQTKELEPT